MAYSFELLKPLVCPKGCDPDFIQYLYWEGTQERIAQNSYSAVQGTRWTLGLRCANCHTHYSKPGVPNETKKNLDLMLDAHQGKIKDFHDEIVDARLRGHLIGLDVMLEENGV